MAGENATDIKDLWGELRKHTAALSDVKVLIAESLGVLNEKVSNNSKDIEFLQKLEGRRQCAIHSEKIRTLTKIVYGAGAVGAAALAKGAVELLLWLAQKTS